MSDTGTAELLIDDLIYKLRERGYRAECKYCVNPKGELISIAIDIIGRLD